MLLPWPCGFRDTPVTAIRFLARNSDAASFTVVMAASSAPTGCAQGYAAFLTQAAPWRDAGPGTNVTPPAATRPFATAKRCQAAGRS
jgi:hypothetical protein